MQGFAHLWCAAVAQQNNRLVSKQKQVRRVPLAQLVFLVQTALLGPPALPVATVREVHLGRTVPLDPPAPPVHRELPVPQVLFMNSFCLLRIFFQ